MREIPEHWKIGQEKGVGPEWLMEFPDFIRTAETKLDLMALRKILAARATWVRPFSVSRLSLMLEQRAEVIGATIEPVVPPALRGTADHDDPQDRAWSPEVFDRANNLCRCPEGEAAARGGYLNGLHEFVRNHGRLPSDARMSSPKNWSSKNAPTELGLVKHNARFIRGVVDGSVKASAEYRKMAKSFVEREKKRVREIFGENFE